MRLLFLGDVMGRSGRDAVNDRLPGLIEQYKFDFVVVNGENASHGKGLTEPHFNAIRHAGADVVTLGDHAFDQRETISYIERENTLIRPINMPPGTPGRGAMLITGRNGHSVLVVNALVSAAFVAACATFTPGVPFAWIVGILIIGGFFRSLEFTSLNTIAYADVDNRRMSRATSLVAVAQQVSISVGVAIGALAVDLTLWAHGHTTITAADFQPAFIVIAVISACAFFVFVRLPHDAGAELARRTPTPGPTEATDQKLS
jgi:hypothetical protein